jgi:hypothetical protein
MGCTFVNCIGVHDPFQEEWGPGAQFVGRLCGHRYI